MPRVEQFSEDIGRYLNGLPVLARKDTLRYRSTKFIRRNKDGVMATLKGHRAPLCEAVFSPDGKILATASEDSTAMLWYGGPDKEAPARAK